MKARLLSLDVFRGMTVFFMIIVNSSGNWSKTYAPLLHAQWHGFTPTDLVFPSFLFAVGASIFMVMDKWKNNLTQAQVYKKILLRTLIIFILGFLMYWFPFCNWLAEGGFELRPFSETRIMGVLQRIALAYGISALLLYKFSLRTNIKIVAGILFFYFLIMIGWGDLSMAGNFAQYLDLAIIGAPHLYQGEGIPFDPEGLFSTLPCLGNVIAGYATVHYLKNEESYKQKFKLALVAALLIGLAFLWHYGFPINKKLWTSSYVLLTSGISIFMLLGLHFYLDHKNTKPHWSKLFTPMGKNPLFIYLLSEVGIIYLYWIPNSEYGNVYSACYEMLFKWSGEYFGAFLFALSWTLICWAIAAWMDRKGWYVRV